MVTTAFCVWNSVLGPGKGPEEAESAIPGSRQAHSSECVVGPGGGLPLLITTAENSKSRLLGSTP